MTLHPKLISVFIAFTALVSVLTSCSTLKDTQVTSTYDLSAQSVTDFQVFKTYQWITDEFRHNGKKPNAAIEQQITSAINKALVNKGFSQDSNDPDFLINYGVTAEDRVDIRQYHVSDYEGYAPGFVWRKDHGLQVTSISEDSQTEMVEYRHGTLVIDIVQPTTNKIIWRGIGTKVMPYKPGSVRRNMIIKEVVNATLEQFPPGKAD